MASFSGFLDVECLLEIIISIFKTKCTNKYQDCQWETVFRDLSSVYMDIIEDRSLHHLNIGLYKRYVDDCFCLTTNVEEARIILTTMNAQDENISFDIELPENGSLALLDFSVSFHNSEPSS